MEPTTERTFSFTVKLPHSSYVKLLSESRKREKLSAAVPSRTARQLIIERLEEMSADHPTPPKHADQPQSRGAARSPEGTRVPIEPETFNGKLIKNKRGVGENEHSPTEGIE